MKKSAFTCWLSLSRYSQHFKMLFQTHLPTHCTSRDANYFGGAACFTCVQVLSASWMAWVDFYLGGGGGLLRSRLASLRLGPFFGRMPNPPGYEGGLCLALDATSVASSLMTQDFTAARPYLALGPCFAFALLYFSQPSCFCSLALFFRAFTSASALLPLGLCSPRPLPFKAGC